MEDAYGLRNNRSGDHYDAYKCNVLPIARIFILK